MDSKEQQIVYSQPIPAGKRRYFFDVKETHGGDLYITITESRRIFDDHTGQFHFEKSKLFLYKEDFAHFTEGLQDVISYVQNQLGTIEERQEWKPEAAENEEAAEGDEPKKKGLLGFLRK